MLKLMLHRGHLAIGVAEMGQQLLDHRVAGVKVFRQCRTPGELRGELCSNSGFEELLPIRGHATLNARTPPVLLTILDYSKND